MALQQEHPQGVPPFYASGGLAQWNGTDQAANTENSETVPANEYWLVKSISVSLVQGATQTPQPTLIIDDGTDVISQSFGASSAQNSSVTTQYTWAPGHTLTAGGAATSATAPLPDGLVLGPGFRVRTVTAGIGANSNYGPLSFYGIKFTRR